MTQDSDTSSNKKKGIASRIPSVLAVVLLVIIVALVLLIFNLNSTIRMGGEKVVTSLTGGKTTIGDVSMSLLQGEVLLKDIVIKNPAQNAAGEKTDFTTEDFFKLGLLRVKLDMTSVLSDVIHIQEILIDKPFVSYEKTPLCDSNHHVLMENIEASTKSDGKKDEKKETEEKEGKKIIIDHMCISHGTLNLSTLGLTAPLPLPTIDIKDLGKKRSGVKIGTAIAETMSALFSSTLQVVRDQGKTIANFGRKTSEKGGDALESVGEALKNTGKSIKDAGKSLKESGKNLLDKLVN